MHQVAESTERPEILGIDGEGEKSEVSERAE
jgi:hypothetical protein